MRCAAAARTVMDVKRGISTLRKRLFVCILAICLFASSCAKDHKKTLYIAEQFGTAYAPVAYMRETGILESKLKEGITVEWSRLNNTAAIREAMLAGKVDIGFMAIPPFLIGKDGGMDWQICAGVSKLPMGLISADPGIRSIHDIGAARIALPQPGSVQHILLAMAAEKELGRHDAFDNQLVTMSHPDGMSALLSGSEIKLYFTTEPYLSREIEAGMQQILSAEQAAGEPFTGIVAVADKSFVEEGGVLYELFLAALYESIEEINANPYAAAKLLAPVYDMSEEALYRELTAAHAGYSKEVEGLALFADFLYRAGYIKKTYDIRELTAFSTTVQ